MFSDTIRDNIKKYGHHITFVTNGAEPRYAYTIGVYEKFGFELVFAGGIYYMQNEVKDIINDIVSQLKLPDKSDLFTMETYGQFKLSKIHHSWNKLMMLGFFDYYKLNNVQAFQIIPAPEYFTLDIPNMSKEWMESSEPVWKWLSKKWGYLVPEDSKVTTNINSLHGEKITEVMRWEKDEWEAFAGAGPDVEKKDIRIVSLGTLLGIDPSLEPILNLKIGKGIWRDSTELKWHKWN